jgi:mannose-6-phosphate isomerase-like protein (cupin superfamily)
MSIKHFDKSKAGKGCMGTIYGEHMFTKNMEGFLDEIVWGFLKKGMQVYPHKHPQREIYIFIKGEGIMQVNDNKFPVAEGDAVYIQSNAFHTAWNNEDTDLEFILIRARKLGYFGKNITKLLSKFG